MTRLDVHAMPVRGQNGYVLDVQADLLSHLATRTVVALLSEDTALKPISDLNPVFDIRGKRHLMVTKAIASIPKRELKRVIASLMEQHDSVTRALDTLLLGF